jgi:hypothetical protein
MNLAQAQARHDAMLPYEPDDSAYLRRVSSIENNTDRTFVGDLLLGDLPDEADDEERIDGIRSMAAVTAYAIDAWTIIERLDTGLPLSDYQRAMLPKFFNELKPWIAKELIVIRQAAEKGL